MNAKKEKLIAQFARLQALANRHQKQHFASVGLSASPYSGQGRVLLLLKEKLEISQKELTSILDMTKQATAQLLDKLEKNHYITRNTSKEDRRVLIIKLTESGMKLATEMEIVPHERGTEFDCLQEDELDILSGYMERLIKRFEELNVNTDNNDKNNKGVKK
ncbi:hypothetical protein FACS189418_5720 [Clostridia bacterium]|nr:hypothetical protein FACS189418_5720 [Clostridia bacterium]